MHCWWSKTIWRRVTSAHSLSASNISACRQQHLFPARHWQQPCEKDQSWGLVGLQGENPPSCSPERWMSCSGYSLENERCSEGQGDRRKIGGQQDRPVNQVFWVQGGQRQQVERSSPSLLSSWGQPARCQEAVHISKRGAGLSSPPAVGRYDMNSGVSHGQFVWLEFGTLESNKMKIDQMQLSGLVSAGTGGSFP